MRPEVIHLVGPGGAGKTTTGARLAERLGVTFIDLDARFAATHGDISWYLEVHGYPPYARQNVQTYLDVLAVEDGPIGMTMRLQAVASLQLRSVFRRASEAPDGARQPAA